MEEGGYGKGPHRGGRGDVSAPTARTCTADRAPYRALRYSTPGGGVTYTAHTAVKYKCKLISIVTIIRGQGRGPQGQWALGCRGRTQAGHGGQADTHATYYCVLWNAGNYVRYRTPVIP
jgi:hypothetical protein